MQSRKYGISQINLQKLQINEKETEKDLIELDFKK